MLDFYWKALYWNDTKIAPPWVTKKYHPSGMMLQRCVLYTVRALSETQEEAAAEATLLAPIESSLSMTMEFLLKEDILLSSLPAGENIRVEAYLTGDSKR